MTSIKKKIQLSIFGLCLVSPAIAEVQNLETLNKKFPPVKDFDHSAEMLSVAETMTEGVPEGAMTVQPIEVSGQPFKKAITVDIKKPGASPWAVRLKFTEKHHWQKGETGIIAFYARTLATKNPFGASSLLLQYKPAYDDWRGHVQRDLFLTKEWKLITIPFETQIDVPNTPNTQLQLFFGGVEPQTIQLADLHVFSYGKSTPLAKLPLSKTYYPGIEDDAPWRKAALKRIQKLRTAQFKLKLTDSQGKPISNAKVHLTLKRHKFGFGAAVRSEEMAVGANGVSQKRRDQYAEILNKTCSKITPTNGMKWKLYAQMKNNLEQLLTWCKKHDMTVRGHVLIWPGFARLPEGYNLYKKNKTAFRKDLVDHIKKFTNLYPDTFSEWDVMNEPYTEHEFMDLLGKEVVLEWFQTAQSPKYLSYINDYGILSDNNSEHRKNYHYWIDYIVKNKAPLDGIGFQGHFKSPVPPEEILHRIDSFGKYGKKMQITEFDFDYPDTELQAKFFEDFLILIYSHPLMSAHINWIFLADNFRPTAALYDRDFKPTPMGKVWEKLLTQTWHTEKSLVSGKDGAVSTRGYKGLYEVTVELGGKKQTFSLMLDDNTTKKLVVSAK